MISRRDKACAIDGHGVVDLPSLVVLGTGVYILEFEKVIGRVGRERRKRRVADVVGIEPPILSLTSAPKVSMLHRGTRIDASGNANADTLSDVEDVLILGAVWRLFFFVCVAVKVKNAQMGECVHEALTHPAKGRVIEVAVVADVAEDTSRCSFNNYLRRADELYIIVLQPEFSF